MHHAAKTERKVGENVDGREDLKHGQRGDGGKRVWVQVESRRSAPGTLQLNVLELV